MNDDASAPARPAKVRVPAAETPKPESLATLATGVVVVSALYLARDVLIPITLAIFLSFFLTPVVRALQRARLPRAAAVMVAVTLALAVILMLGGVIGAQMKSLVENAPQYQSTVNEKYERLDKAANSLLKQMTSRFGAPHPAANPAPGAPGEAAQEQQPIPVVVESAASSYLETGKQILEPILSPIATLAIVLVVTIFILVQKEDLRDRLIRLFGSNDLHRTTVAIDEATTRLTRYFLLQAAVNACFGLAVGVGLYFIGLPSPILWGLLAALLRFIPYVGSITAAVLPIALAAAVDPGWSRAAWTAALFVVAEGVTGQFLEPILYGNSTGLSPTAVVIVAIFWGWIWGPIGLILSTPLTLCLVVVGRHVRRLEFFDVLLGDRPALSPVETLYQRLLAGDGDEMLEQAETMLKGRALSSYYDEVALNAVRLVASDVARGAVQEAQLDKIQETMLGLIEDLESYDDADPVASRAKAKAEAAEEVAGFVQPDACAPAQPAPQGQMSESLNLPEVWRGQRSMLCVPGRHPLDEVAAAMLAQLLRKHGFGAATARHGEVSRLGIGRLDPTGVAMVCLVYAELVGSPPHMRYLARRVRQKFPSIPLLVGLWEPGDEMLKDEAAQGLAGPALTAGSLSEAVTKCLEEARRAEEPAPGNALGNAPDQGAAMASAPVRAGAAPAK